jgi:hypothetical protein
MKHSLRSLRSLRSFYLSCQEMSWTLILAFLLFYFICLLETDCRDHTIQYYVLCHCSLRSLTQFPTFPPYFPYIPMLPSRPSHPSTFLTFVPNISLILGIQGRKMKERKKKNFKEVLVRYNCWPSEAVEQI